SIVNDPENLVPEALEGLVLSNPLQLELHEQHRFVTRRERARNKVGLVSGGGSGHEPLHAGFVGAGMLDVAVAGAVFASPTALQPPPRAARVGSSRTTPPTCRASAPPARSGAATRPPPRWCWSTTIWPPTPVTRPGPAAAAPPPP